MSEGCRGAGFTPLQRIDDRLETAVPPRCSYMCSLGLECSNSHNVPTIGLLMIHLLLWHSTSILSCRPDYLGSFLALCTLLTSG